MDTVWQLLPAHLWAATLAVALFAGVVKGIVGFALPMICVSMIGSFASPQLAIAGMLLPTLVTNLMQALAAGRAGARLAVSRFRLFLLAGLVCMVATAQLVPAIPPRLYFLGLGIPVSLYAIIMLAGYAYARVSQRPSLDISVGAVAGLFGGLAGIWGPPTVAYLTALQTPKAQQMQIQGVIYFSGTVVLIAAHGVSGIVTEQTLLFSAVLVVPAMLGMALGLVAQRHIDQNLFRRATLVVLLIAGANLVRRGMMA